MRLAVILVHYHTPELAAAAVEALRADVAGTGLEVDWLLIDNGSDAPGRARLASLPVERIDPGTNLGYAGGVNLGMARSNAELVVLMNPDVMVLPGCVPALLDALRNGAAVAGPRFYWDGGRRLLQPPSEVRTRREELARLLAGKSPGGAARARRRWRRHARRHWEAREPLPSHDLSGSLLALRRSAWEAVGPFDEGYRLYFEETDWLLRAARLGLAGRYVPARRGGSPVQPERRPGAASRRVVRGVGAAVPPPVLWALVRRPARRARPPAPPARRARRHPRPGRTGLRLPEEPSAYPLWVEVSPNPLGFPAAAERLSGRRNATLEPRPWRSGSGCPRRS